MTHPLDREPLLLRIDDAAQRLSISRATMYRLIQRGELPIVRISSAVRVRAFELDLWVAGIAAIPGEGTQSRRGPSCQRPSARTQRATA